MRIVSWKKIPALIQIILLLILVFLVISLVFISASTKSDEVNFINIDPKIRARTEGISSTCLTRDILNRPDVLLYSNRSQSKRYYLTIGIPTIVRTIGNEYVLKTLHSLTTQQTVGKTKADILIVIQLGDEERSKRLHLAAVIKAKYPHLINSGALDVIQVNPSFYPSFDKLKQRFGDSTARIKWRSKQVIDFSFLFCYCHGLGKYHLQLEDDVIASPYYYPKLQDFIEKYEKKEAWFTLDASLLGYIGKVYHNYDLNEIASFYYIFYDEMPVDWLEYTWREIKGQTGRWRLRSASLFQHIGDVSSLKKKKQMAREPYFDNQTQKFLGLNPPAVVQTTLQSEQKTNIKSAYEQGGGYFWGRCKDKSKCVIKVMFKKAIPLKRVVIETGGNFALNDTIHQGTLQFGTLPNGNDCVHYQASAAVFKKGSLDIKLSDILTVNCLQVDIQKQKAWVLIREINVWPGN
ncbi:alpha-1,3-mannosyl-glycoprotein 4-beta-N-acetylglucosaminyltransferase C-like [Dendronephthya gigantea]|uniref:alpha-1,3-mannosyl-glycoprotein 4-beta-N-acetylglucosaminyltransferase C-like n=1 Tax=Dendronephthya gigantea TaxID=151771 RepID=UPI00106D5AC6|nr:alpha-1,3-mannosyl-glycoprotein 4-beta-N-acetylglucosaminyltransferase C-like [Dendronephthya gigantea]